VSVLKTNKSPTQQAMSMFKNKLNVYKESVVSWMPAHCINACDLVY